MPPQIVEKEIPLFEYMRERFPDYKKTKLKQILKYGSVTVNGKVTTGYHYALKTGDRVDFLDQQSAFREGLKSLLPFPIVYEDDWLLVVDKPAGLLTMGTERDKIHTVYYKLTDYIRSQSKEHRGRVFIVHRLDRDASGLLIFAKKEPAKRMLQADWASVVKKYYAVVQGTPKKSSETLESYLMEDKFRRVYSTHERSRDAKHAETRYEVLRSQGPYALLDVTLVTGRKNQIRVQLSDFGHPIVGDDKYGGDPSTDGRLFLHAYSLSFRHPETNQIHSFESALPASFKKLVG